jgi:hypothetical protein
MCALSLHSRPDETSREEFNDDLDSYRSWEAFIAEMRRRWLAGEPIPPGPWYKPPRDEESA